MHHPGHKNSAENQDAFYSNIESYFWKNKQCKLPWSFPEIDDAIESIHTRLKKVGSL